MQFRNESDYPQRFGSVSGFCGASAEYLELIKNDLGLAMPIYSRDLPCKTLSYVRENYRTHERREPDVQEIIMCDILMWNAMPRAKERCLMLAQLSTNSEDIRETFTDAMQKLRAIDPKRTGNVRLDELLSVAGSYIMSVMPERYFEGLDVSRVYEKDGLLAAKAEGSADTRAYRAGEMDFILASKAESISIKEGVYIQVERNDGLCSFIDALREKDIKFGARVIEHNIIETVIGECDNAEINVPSSLPSLAAFGEGDLLILCCAELEQNIVSVGNAHGLRMRRAGRKLKKGGIIFKSPMFGFSVGADFLRSITDRSMFVTICPELGDDLLEGKAKCRFEMITRKPRNGDFEESHSHEGGREDVSVMSVCGDMTSPFESGIAQAVISAAGAVALGASPRKIRQKNIIRYPAQADPSALVAHILGIYRAETELCLLSRDNVLKVTFDVEKAESRSISVAAKRQTGGFGEGSLWIVSPEEKGGKICFENIRRIFIYMKDLIASGHVIRACALDTDGFSGSEGESKKTPVGSFLVLTRAELIPSEGINTERVGSVGIDEGAEF